MGSVCTMLDETSDPTCIRENVYLSVCVWAYMNFDCYGELFMNILVITPVIYTYVNSSRIVNQSKRFGHHGIYTAISGCIDY